MPRIVGYCRVSTIGQRDEGVSLDTQHERIRTWCRSEGHTLLDTDVYVDGGISGKSTVNRPALTLALELVCRERGILVFYSLSRLARSTRDTIEIADRLDRAGADLVSLSEKLDTTSAAGKLLFRMLAVLGEFERDLVVERTNAAIHFKRTESERIGEIPYGFRLAADGRKLVPDPAERAIVKMVRSLRAEGMTLRAIAERLNRDGLRSKKNHAWTHSSVDSILKTRALDPNLEISLGSHKNPPPVFDTNSPH